MENEALPIVLPSGLIAVFQQTEETPIQFTWTLDKETSPSVKEGDLFYVQEEHCGHWGKETPGATTAVGFSLFQEDGSTVVASESDPLRLYYRADRDEVPLPHLQWIEASKMNRWASRMTLIVRATPNNEVDQFLFEVIKTPIRELAPLPIDVAH